MSAAFRPEGASLLRTARAIREGEIRAAELAERTLARARRLHERLNIFISLRGDDLLAEAEAVDRRRDTGEMLPPLAGKCCTASWMVKRGPRTLVSKWRWNSCAVIASTGAN